MNSKSSKFLQPFLVPLSRLEPIKILDEGPAEDSHLPLDEAKLARIKNQSPAAVQPGWASENPTNFMQKKVG